MHSLGSHLISLFRTRSAWAAPILDDRGQPLAPISEADRIGALSNTANPILEWLAPMRWVALPLLILYFTWDLVRGGTPTALSFFYIAILLIALLQVTISSRGSRRRVAPASMARAGRCGACGFEIASFTAAEDGCVACPECGSAWHQDRWQRQIPDAMALAKVALAPATRRHRVANTTDDRGALLMFPFRIRTGWHRDLLNTPRRSYSARQAELVDDLWRGNERTLRRFLAWGTGLAALAIAYAWLVIEESDVRVVACVVVAMISLILMVVSIISVAPHYVPMRDIALRHSTCPSCGEMLDLTQPRQFDGCIQCAKCAAAWRVADGQTVATANVATQAMQSQILDHASAQEGASP